MGLKLTKFAKFCWVILGVNLFVILWGAYVRASGSGAGCGKHWPLCNGEVIPPDPQIETLVEFTHRLSSGLAFILVIIMLIWAYRAFPPKHIVRLGATLTMVFMITEALVGAGLVLFEWVAQDTSIARVISMAVHLINTFLLLAMITLTAWWASSRETVDFENKGIALWAFGLGFLGVIILGVSGAITALGDTLFPATSLAEGIQQDFSAAAHFVVRLRIWHPIIAIITSAYLFLVSGLLAMYANDELRLIKADEINGFPQVIRHYRNVKFFSFWLIGGLILQLLAGLINLLLLAPIWMQLVHLLFADMVWIGLVLLFSNTFAKFESPELILGQEDNKMGAIPPVNLGGTLARYSDQSQG